MTSPALQFETAADRLPEAIRFGERVRELREEKGWTLERFAEAAWMNEAADRARRERSEAVDDSEAGEGTEGFAG